MSKIGSMRVGVTVITTVIAAAGLLAGCGSGSSHSGSSTTANPTGGAAAAGVGPARNPYLASDVYPVTHVDPAQSDSIPYPVARGTFHVDPTKQPRVAGGPINYMTLAATSPDYRWITSTDGVRYVDVRDGGFTEVASMDAPGAKVTPPAQVDAVVDQDFTNSDQVRAAVSSWGLDWVSAMGNGVYVLVDKDNRLYYNTSAGDIVVFALKNKDKPEDGIQIVKTFDYKPFLTGQGFAGAPEKIVGLDMTYDGHLVVLSNKGMAVLNRDLTGDAQQVRFGDDELVTNSMAIDESGGIYAASDKVMRKVVWTGSKLSTDPADGAWSSPYDFGRQPPTVKFGSGTGSTPTLMGYGKNGDQLVVITDGSDHMKLVAFWRNQIPEGFQQKPGTKSDRIADQIQVTAGKKDPLPEFIQSEQSVVVNGYGAFVVDNMHPGGDPNRLVDVLTGGPIDQAPTGMQRFEWDPTAHKWNSVWERGDVVSVSMVPTVSSASNMVFVNGYSKADGWDVTGLDWNTGETVHRTIFGQSNRGNGAYALIEFTPDGDLIFNSISGPFRARLTN
ncbi:hypothetical protein JK358_36690 [Nocardia sp. 2]|uniref:Uncharacterized protein n=1 Tax=Nocardia acididurans TaxID=2802282 RepID=A0ABS1MH92_9NOCA|nr:hypothetical protein [Nocardia acididurans]MBL1079949.1 hypothetical protein [Nocardia acididurans]